MSKVRLMNDTDETIVVRPGDTIEVIGEKNKIRVLSSRTTVLKVEETREG